MARQTNTPTNPNDSIDKYPLRSLATALRRFVPPSGPFDAAGTWRQTYGVYTLAGRASAARRVGMLRLSREVDADKSAVLRVAYNKQLTGGSQHVTAELHVKPDSVISTPTAWSFETLLKDPAGEAVPHTRLKRRAKFAEGTVTITDASETKRIRIAGDYTVNWCLFDAVGRLPRREGKPLTFTLIDHFDQPKAGTSLSFRKPMDVAVGGGRSIRTFAFDQVGAGNVPWVYWLDERGRLLFVVAGLEGYLLEP